MNFTTEPQVKMNGTMLCVLPAHDGGTVPYIA